MSNKKTVDRGKGCDFAYIRPTAYAFCSACGEQLFMTGGPDIDEGGISLFVQIDHQCNYWTLIGGAKDIRTATAEDCNKEPSDG